MKLWISKNGAETIQEQLSAQIVLGIVSGDLAPGERLPSTTVLARRFHVHANTVGAVYRSLAERRWVIWKRGSGFWRRDFERPGFIDVAPMRDGWKYSVFRKRYIPYTFV